MKDKLKLLGISYVNVVVKNNNFNKFFDVLKEHEFVMAEDYKIVLQAQVDYLVRNDPAIKNGEVPLFTIPVNLEEKTFIINMDYFLLFQNSRNLRCQFRPDSVLRFLRSRTNMRCKRDFRMRKYFF